MKNIYSKALMLLCLIFGATSCVGSLEDINVSPNSATDAPLSALMIGSQVSLIGVYESEDARLAGMWSRQFTGSDRQYAAYHTYTSITSEVFTFFNAYIGVIQPALDAEAKATADNNMVAVGMMQVVRAMTYGYITALYGDIPFTQANNPVEFPNPEYDAQADVYAGIQTLLTTAIGNLQSGNGGIDPSTDLFYGGSVANWVALANTLSARYHLHVGNDALAVAAAANGIGSTAGDMMASHGTSVGGNQNTWYDFIVQDRAGYLTAWDSYLASSLDASSADYRGDAKTDESARFSYLFTVEVDGYEPNIGATGMFAQDASYPLATFVENMLISAEATINSNGSNADALTCLNAVRAALAAQFPAGQYDAYDIADFQAGGIAYDGTSETSSLLAEIIEEKYTSLVAQTEVFNDMRRLDNPSGLSPVAGTAFPERFLYPTDEVNSNANVPNPLPGLYDPTPVNM